MYLLATVSMVSTSIIQEQIRCLRRFNQKDEEDDDEEKRNDMFFSRLVVCVCQSYKMNLVLKSQSNLEYLDGAVLQSRS